ncbi:membrane fusion protein, macrolide-specific efflux system [Micromonospora pattaloongensis]|uniref:Membrane fusion protein, macrolide-specific efflux system n=1 Tax=Micromonospora pattaloongensis TaxID=405436 RepID=A0A1H3STS6_9ACTN|nr:membrane fusion protein, macrolide-specific efflux system [Micromonospora pattaloongensis]
MDRAELDVDEAEDAVAGTTLKAPMAGTVVAVNGTVGGSASATCFRNWQRASGRR